MRYRTSTFWHVCQRIKRQKLTIELMYRDARVYQFIARSLEPVSLKDVRLQMGLSHKQAIESLARIYDNGGIHYEQYSAWNGMFYIYPYRFWAIRDPRNL